MRVFGDGKTRLVHCSLESKLRQVFWKAVFYYVESLHQASVMSFLFVSLVTLWKCIPWWNPAPPCHWLKTCWPPDFSDDSCGIDWPMVKVTNTGSLQKWGIYSPNHESNFRLLPSWGLRLTGHLSLGQWFESHLIILFPSFCFLIASSGLSKDGLWWRRRIWRSPGWGGQGFPPPLTVGAHSSAQLKTSSSYPPPLPYLQPFLPEGSKGGEIAFIFILWMFCSGT